jgi:hypothetical protein
MNVPITIEIIIGNNGAKNIEIVIISQTLSGVSMVIPYTIIGGIITAKDINKLVMYIDSNRLVTTVMFFTGKDITIS